MPRLQSDFFILLACKLKRNSDLFEFYRVREVNEWIEKFGFFHANQPAKFSTRKVLFAFHFENYANQRRELQITGWTDQLQIYNVLFLHQPRSFA